MRLYEYEGKELFKGMGIPVPASIKAVNGAEVVAACEKMGFPAVVKAQVLSGGRGKAGLIKVVGTKQEAVAAAEHIMKHLAANELMLVEEKITATAEAYIGFTADDLSGRPIAVISRQGGVDVEQIAAGSGSVVKQALDPELKAYNHIFLNMAKDVGFQGGVLVQIADIALKMYEMFLKYDAETVEINPVMIDGAGKVVAGDAKVIADDYALFRQPQLEEYRSKRDRLQSDVKSIFVDLGGNIGVISLGASMTMMVIDTIKYMGGEPANFVDVAGGASKQNLKDMALQVMQRAVDNPDMKGVLATFTLVAHPLRSAVEAVVEAYQEIKPSVPVLVAIRAASAALISMSNEEAKKLLEDAGIIWCEYLDEAIACVVETSKGA